MNVLLKLIPTLLLITWGTLLLGQRTPKNANEGDFFPNESLWFNTNGKVTFQEVKDKYCVVMVNDIRNLEGSYCAKALELLSTRFYALQFIHTLAPPVDYSVSRTDILRYIQQNNFHHPIGVLPDFSGFKTSTIQELPYFLVYDRNNQPIYQGSGINAFLEIEQLLQNFNTSNVSKEYSHYQITSSIKPTDWANPLIEFPTHIAPQHYGNGIYVNDVAHHRILGINRYGECETVDGASILPGYDDEQEGDIFFQHPSGITTDGELLYVADTYNNRIRQVNRNQMQAITINGNGRPDSLGLPTDVEFWKNRLYVLDGLRNQVRLVNIDKKTSTLFAQLPTKRIGMNRVYPLNLAAGKKVLYVTMSDGELWTIDKKGKVNLVSPPGNIRVNAVCEWKGGLAAVSAENNAIYLMKKNKWELLADGKDTQSMQLGIPPLNRPYDITVVNGELYISDTYNHCIRVIHSEKESTPHIFRLQLNDLLISEEQANTYGQLVVLDTVFVSQQTTAVKVQLDLQGYQIKSGGKNLLVMQETPEAVEILTPEIKTPELAFTVLPNKGLDAIYLECYLTLEHPDTPHFQIIKRSYLVFPLEYNPNAEQVQLITYKPDLLPH
ncbi:MAG TPA: hypothetical protein VIK71_04630 [Flavobacteriales bacterium]